MGKSVVGPSTIPRLFFSRRSVCTSTDDAREHLRAFLRDTAQPVVVVTAVLPNTSPTYHGATLSSFTSVALDPFPLVAFSLRIPSRMASALNAHVGAPQPSSPSSHLVINILSASQPHLAHRFARPDIHPRPFADPRVPFSLSQDGIPILSGALGALSCYLVGRSLPLARLGGSDSDVDTSRCKDAPLAPPNGITEGEVQQTSGATGLASELFIARVLRVEPVPLLEEDERDGSGIHKLPLLYHRRCYTTVGTK